MKSVILPLLIFMLTAGIAIAENQEKAQKPTEGFKNERVVKMRGGKYSRMYISLIHKTQKLGLNKEQRDQLNKVGKEYAQIIIEQENESRFAQRDFMQQLKNSDFDPVELKKLTKDSEAADLKAGDAFIDGLVELKKIVGPDNFAKLIPLTKVNRNALVKLKEGNNKTQMESKEAGKQQPEATTK